MAMVTPAPIKKKAYHHGDLRNAIIIQAVARARRDGEKAIVLREIAAEIGVSATAAYRHFTNRAQLVEEVGAKGFEACRERMVLPPVTDGGAEPTGDRTLLAAYLDLRNACLAMLDFTCEEPSWSRLMFDALGSSEQVSREAHEGAHRVLAGIVERGTAAGVFVPGVDLGEDRTFWSAIDGLATVLIHRLYPGHTRVEILGEAGGRLLDAGCAHVLTDGGRSAVAAAGPCPDSIVTDLREWVAA